MIDPGAGLDDVRAGDGNDTVRAQDGIGEWVACGLGTDMLTGDFDDVPVTRARPPSSPPGPIPASRG